LYRRRLGSSVLPFVGGDIWLCTDSISYIVGDQGDRIPRGGMDPRGSAPYLAGTGEDFPPRG
jgi:hypothetical protein